MTNTIVNYLLKEKVVKVIYDLLFIVINNK